MGKVAEKLLGVAPSASAVSRLNQALTEQYEAWRVRPLLAHYRIIYLDGIHFTVRHGAKTDATMILTALGVDLEGSREVLAFRACAEEDKDGWSWPNTNIDSVAEMPRHIQAGRKSDRIGKDCVK